MDTVRYDVDTLRSLEIAERPCGGAEVRSWPVLDRGPVPLPLASLISQWSERACREADRALLVGP